MLRLLIAISLNLLLLSPLALPSTGGVLGRNADSAMQMAGDAGRYQRYPTALGRGRGVGLVLSGGGARGLAHIGVIKALEENHIPIDYISGTSIGAIVGVFYALGYTPDEMLQLFKSQEFKYWSSGDIPERYRYYFLQYGNDARLLTLSVARQDSLFRLVLPSHLVKTTEMDIAFLELMASGNAVAGGNFDRLFRPFRCVASDVYRKQSRVFRQGDLGTCVRASMTYPLLFRATEMDSALLFDGGIYNNYPWDVMVREFGPRIIVGSNVSGNYPQPASDDLIGQLGILIMNPTDYALPDSLGVSVETQLPGIGILDFDLADSLVAAGYRQAIQAMPQIKARVRDRMDSTTLAAQRSYFNRRKPPLIFSRDVEIEGLSPLQAKNIEKALIKRRNAFSLEQLKHEYFKLSADCRIDRIYPTARYNDATGHYKLNLQITKANRLDLSLGGNVSSSNLNNIFLALDFKLFSLFMSRIHASGTVGHLYSNAEVGFRQDVLRTLPFYYAFGYRFSRYDYHTSSPIAIFDDSRPPYLKLRDSYFYWRVGTPMSYNSQFELVLNYGFRYDDYFLVPNFLKKDVADETFIHYLYTAMEMSRETMNHRQFPTLGQEWIVRLAYLRLYERNTPGSTATQRLQTVQWHSWYGLHARWRGFIPLFDEDRISLGLLGDAQLSLRSAFANYTSDLLATPRFTPTLTTRSVFVPQLRANQYLAIGIIPSIKLLPNLYFQIQGYGFLPLRQTQADANQRVTYSDWLSSHYLFGEANLFYHTIAGPISLNVGYLPGWRGDFWNDMLVSLNIGLVLFKRMGTEY